MDDIDRRIKQKFCYVCLETNNVSIKKRYKTWIQYICKPCRNKQMKAYLTYYVPPKKTKEIGWSESWLQKAKESEERISKRGVNYGTSN